MSSYYYAYGGGYRSSYSGGSDGDYYHGYTYHNPENGAYSHYSYASDNGTISTEAISQGGGSYTRDYTYDNPANGNYRSEQFTAQLEGDGTVYQHYQGVDDIPAYHHDEYVSQTVTGTQSQGYQVDIQGAQVNTYLYNNVTYGYVRGESTATGSGYGEYVSGYRTTDIDGESPSTSYYGGYRSFGYFPG